MVRVCLLLSEVNMVGAAISRRSFLFKLIPKNSVGAEIGVWQGQFTNYLIEKVNPKMLHLIDPWVWRKGFKRWKFKGEKIVDQMVVDKIYKFICNTYGVNSNVTVHRERSEVIYNIFPDEYFDWIYIDGDHSFDSVYNDMKNYYPKVKTGGLIIGDDFRIRGARVRRALEKFTNENNIEYKSRTDQYWFRKEEKKCNEL